MSGAYKVLERSHGRVHFQTNLCCKFLEKFETLAPRKGIIPKLG